MSQVSLFGVDRVTRLDRNHYSIVIRSAQTRDAMQTMHGSHISFIFILQMYHGIRIIYIPPTCQTLTMWVKSSCWWGLNLEWLEIQMKIWLATAIFSCRFFVNNLKYTYFRYFKTWGRNIVQNGTTKHICSCMKAQKGQRSDKLEISLEIECFLLVYPSGTVNVSSFLLPLFSMSQIKHFYFFINLSKSQNK